MRFSKIALGATLLALLGSLPLPAAATVEVLEAQGNLQHWILAAGSHSPCAGASWSHDVAEGTSFDLQAASFDGSCIESIWSGRIDAGGLVFTGDLSPATEGSGDWWVHMESQVSALLELTAPARISATRSVEGFLSSSLHTVVLTFADGTVDVLLGANAEDNSSERQLGPGIYRLTFLMEADDVWDAPSGYRALVEVNWEQPVRQAAVTWGAVKSLYR